MLIKGIDKWDNNKANALKFDVFHRCDNKAISWDQLRPNYGCAELEKQLKIHIYK